MKKRTPLIQSMRIDRLTTINVNCLTSSWFVCIVNFNMKMLYCFCRLHFMSFTMAHNYRCLIRDKYYLSIHWQFAIYIHFVDALFPIFPRFTNDLRFLLFTFWTTSKFRGNFQLTVRNSCFALYVKNTFHTRIATCTMHMVFDFNHDEEEKKICY